MSPTARTATLQGRSLLSGNASATADAYKYCVANGTLVLDNGYALTNNTSGGRNTTKLLPSGRGDQCLFGCRLYSAPRPGFMVTPTTVSTRRCIWATPAPDRRDHLNAKTTNNVSDGDVGFTNTGRVHDWRAEHERHQHLCQPDHSGLDGQPGQERDAGGGDGRRGGLHGRHSGQWHGHHGGGDGGRRDPWRHREIGRGQHLRGPTTVNNGTLLLPVRLASARSTSATGAPWAAAARFRARSPINSGGSLYSGTWPQARPGTVLTVNNGS